MQGESNQSPRKARKSNQVRSDIGPFTIIPEWILYGPLSGNAVKLYGILSRHADDSGQSYPSKKRLGELVGVSVNTIDRLIAELEEAMAISVTNRRREDGGKATNLYTVMRGGPPVAGGTHTPPMGGAPHPTDGVRKNESQKEEREPTNETPLPAAPVDVVKYDPLRGMKIDRQDLVWNAVAAAIDTDESPHGSRMRAACAQIREAICDWVVATRRVTPAQIEEDPEKFERAMAETVRVVAARLREGMPGLTWGPEGLSRHFRRGLQTADESRSIEEIVEEARRESGR